MYTYVLSANFVIYINLLFSTRTVLIQEHKEYQQNQSSPNTELSSAENERRESVESESSSSSDNNNSPDRNANDRQAAEQRILQHAISKTPMHDILKHIEENNISKIYDNKNLHYFFLKHCVINVISRKKWKENMSRYDYSRFIHYTDEGFALLVLENNVTRYREMRDRAIKSTQQTANNEDEEDEYEYTQPVYTTVTKKGKRSSGKGWNDAGKTRFKVLSKIVQTKRQNQLWLTQRKKSIKRRALADSNESNKRQKRTIVDHDQQMSTSEELEWNQFIADSINDTEWINNAVGV